MSKSSLSMPKNDACMLNVVCMTIYLASSEITGLWLEIMILKGSCPFVSIRTGFGLRLRVTGFSDL